MENDTKLIEAQQVIENELLFSYAKDKEGSWLAALNARINELIQHDFAKLVFILYRLDVSESKLTKLLKNFPESDAGQIIAELVVERQLQKITSRETFRNNDSNIDENEKW